MTKIIWLNWIICFQLLSLIKKEGLEYSNNGKWILICGKGLSNYSTPIQFFVFFVIFNVNVVVSLCQWKGLGFTPIDTPHFEFHVGCIYKKKRKKNWLKQLMKQTTLVTWSSLVSTFWFIVWHCGPTLPLTQLDTLIFYIATGQCDSIHTRTLIQTETLTLTKRTNRPGQAKCCQSVI